MIISNQICVLDLDVRFEEKLFKVKEVLNYLANQEKKLYTVDPPNTAALGTGEKWRYILENGG